jgi:hypothetical protein
MGYCNSFLHPADVSASGETTDWSNNRLWADRAYAKPLVATPRIKGYSLGL